ncbi:helix-turn-helix transcriptional regulator [Streptomyces sp. DT2A-34]|nr:helix-turn-helix transcriptional regulator [Streptomyces sp. DT2A-34]MDO0913146.1 helix-turn-helix transcriptional regulator [Streptomyces sp. DT2A-34]
MRPKLTQQQLADAARVSLGTIRKIERGERGVSDSTLEAIADAVGVDPMRLRTDRGPVHTRVHEALPVLSAVLATYDSPEDGPIRPHQEMRAAVADAARWRLAAQYTRIVRELPSRPQCRCPRCRAGHGPPCRPARQGLHLQDRPG